MKKVPIWRNTSLENLPDEEWRDITGFEGFYKVSNYSRIKSLNRIDCRGHRRPEKILLQNVDPDGYTLVIICKDRINYTRKPHRLSAIEFIPNPLNLPEVNHLDTVKTNNHISNFEWSTTSNNQKHIRRSGKHMEIAETHKSATLTNKKALKIFNESGKHVDIAKKHKTSPLIVSRIKSGKTWSFITGKVYIKRKIA